MPLPIDPLLTFHYVLPEDRARHPDQQRALIVLWGSSRDWMNVSRLYADAMNNSTRDDVWTGKLVEALAVVVVGFHNMTDGRGQPLAWSGPESLMDALSHAAMQDLCVNLSAETYLKDIDRKKSARQSPTTSGDSAGNAAMGSA